MSEGLKLKVSGKARSLKAPTSRRALFDWVKDAVNGVKDDVAGAITPDGDMSMLDEVIAGLEAAFDAVVVPFDIPGIPNLLEPYLKRWVRAKIRTTVLRLAQSLQGHSTEPV